VRVVRGHSRLCCLMRYFPERWFRRWGGVVQGGGEGLEPHIPFKGGGEVRDERSKKAKQVLSSALYRLRALGVFGALKTRLACGFLQETSPLMAQKRALLEALAYTSGCSSPSLCLYPGSSGFSSFGPSISKTSPRILDTTGGGSISGRVDKTADPKSYTPASNSYYHKILW